MNNTMPAATYTKLRSGAWGIKIASTDIAKGHIVTVAKRDGSTKVETVAAIVWQGNGTTIAAIAQKSSGGSQSYGRRYSRGGAAANVAGYSSWCTGRDGCRCFDCE